MNKHHRIPGRQYLRRLGARRPSRLARIAVAVTLALVVLR